MGWTSESMTRLFGRIVENLEEEVPDIDTREGIYRVLIPIFEDEDCNTLEDILGEDVAFDSVFEELYPELIEEEDEE
jgi:hypothetical protein